MLQARRRLRKGVQMIIAVNKFSDTLLKIAADPSLVTNNNMVNTTSTTTTITNNINTNTTHAHNIKQLEQRIQQVKV